MLKGVTGFIEGKPKLKVNAVKTSICRPMMKTTVTIARLKRRGYIGFYVYFQRFSLKGNYKLDFDFC